MDGVAARAPRPAGRSGSRNLLVVVLFILLVGAAITYVSLSRGGLRSAYPLELPGVGQRVALVRITGAISTSSGGFLGADYGVDAYIKMLDEARRDPTIKAVVIVFDSPGGEAGAAERLYYAVKKLAENKTVVAYGEGLMASGAYEAALPAREIVASPSCLVGAVGVYSVVFNVQRLLDKVGVTVYTFKSGPLKDVGNPFRNMTREDIEVMQDIVDQLFKIFKERVIAHRGEVSDEVFTGRPFVASQALEAGLIDKVGTLDDAIQEAKRLAGLPENAPVEELRPPTPSLLDLLFGTSTRTPLVVPSQAYLAMWPPPVAALPP